MKNDTLPDARPALLGLTQFANADSLLPIGLCKNPQQSDFLSKRIAKRRLQEIRQELEQLELAHSCRLDLLTIQRRETELATYREQLIQLEKFFAEDLAPFFALWHRLVLKNQTAARAFRQMVKIHGR